MSARSAKMLEYAKSVLSRVSFDDRLFEKELIKALRVLLAEEIAELKAWCYAQFSGQHGAILNRCFSVA